MDAEHANNRGRMRGVVNVHHEVQDGIGPGAALRPGCEDGATVTEYAIMLALIAMTCIGAATALGTKVQSVFAFLP